MRGALICLIAALASLTAVTQGAYVPSDPWDDGRSGLGAVTDGVVGPAHTEAAAVAHVSTDDWFTLPPLNYIPPPYHRDVLEGLRICLDPGHAGGVIRDDGRISEAMMNLEVALILREFLQDSGAEVVMTRETCEDTPNDGSLEWRARLADRENCDLFISIHQNATGRESANYISVWYHSRPDHPRAANDLARWVTVELHRLLRHHEPQHAGLYSSWLMYGPRGLADGYRHDTAEGLPSGFGVLRSLRVPGILIEGAFQSHPEGAQQLRDREYLRRMAWGLYTGILNYVWAGIPSITLHEDQSEVVEGPRPDIHLALDDGMHEGWARNAPPRIHFETLRVYIDDERATLRYRPQTAEIFATPREDLVPGEHTVRLRVLNVWGNWSWPVEIPFTVEGT
jgi:N-acetylmuramoyl-L-alanine amidase